MTATIECHGVRTGLTLTASLWPDQNDTADATAVTCTEAATRKGCYTFANATLTGLHLIHLIDGGGVTRWYGWAVLAATGVIIAEDTRELALVKSQIDGISGGGGGGTGSLAVVFTVADSVAAPILNAKVSAWLNGIMVAVGFTDVNGQTTLSVDAGTYQIVTTAQGFNGAASTIAIATATPRSVTLQRIVISPSLGELLTGWLIATDIDGNPASGIIHYLDLTTLPKNGTGTSFDNGTRQVTSGVDGLVQFTNLTPGATYNVRRRSTGARFAFVATDSGDGTFEIVDCKGP